MKVSDLVGIGVIAEEEKIGVTMPILAASQREKQTKTNR
jgi:hypothetical protein